MLLTMIAMCWNQRSLLRESFGKGRPGVPNEISSTTFCWGGFLNFEQATKTSLLGEGTPGLISSFRPYSLRT